VTLRRRLLLAFAYLLLLTVVALAVPLAISVDRRARDAFSARIDSQTQVVAASLGGSPTPGETVAGARAAVARYARETDARVIVTNRRGRLIADSSQPRPAPVNFDTAGRPEIADALAGRGARFVRHSADLGGDIVVVAYPILDDGAVTGAVRLSQPVAAVDSRVRRSWTAIAAIAALVALVGLAVAWVLATSLVRPLRTLRATAARLGAGDLEARAPEDGARDIADVARALNSMADELAGMIEAQREFVGNASHQLRTPLTGLRLRLEGLAADAPDSADTAAALAEVDRLSGLVSDLLVLARAGVPPEAAGRSDLGEQATAAVARWHPVAVEHDQTLSLDVPGQEVMVAADPADLAAVLDNLIENAIVYCPPGSSIEVSAASGGLLTVADNGPGIDPADSRRVFDRFYRGHSGRDVPGGTGLGLAIVRDLTARWGGSVELDRDTPGTRVLVRLPALRGERIAGP
jgi:signal transduction histidine kinase